MDSKISSKPPAAPLPADLASWALPAAAIGLIERDKLKMRADRAEYLTKENEKLHGELADRDESIRRLSVEVEELRKRPRKVSSSRPKD